MMGMTVIRPDPDSHFRLVPCKACRSEDVVYKGEQVGDARFWQVECRCCGCTVDKSTQVRHEAQVAWNKENVI